MEEKVFTGKCKLYNVFKKFDSDGDGYMSYDDFGKCLDSIKVYASQEEKAAMIKLIDREQQGHMNFSAFSKVFSPNMSTNLVNVARNDIDYNNLYPSKEIMLDNQRKQS